MKIVVIGGSGYLGSHVADSLSLAGHKVTIFDKKKSKWLKSNQNFIQGNILNTKLLKRVIKNSDIVYHFAALSDVDEATHKPKQTAIINIIGTINVLEAAKKFKVRRVIYASSIYAISIDGGFYRCSKRSAEDYIEEYKKLYGLKFTILRYGSLYGPRSNKTNGVHRIVSDALEMKRLQYIGSKKAKRRYVHVKDAAKASLGVLSKKYENKYINLMGKRTYKVTELFYTLSKLLRLPNKVSFLNKMFTGHYVNSPKLFRIIKGNNYKLKSAIKLEKGLKDLISVIGTSKQTSQIF